MSHDHLPGIEIQRAWSLWNTLNELAENLWNCYEQPFTDLILEEQQRDLVPPDFDELEDEDIPF